MKYSFVKEDDNHFTMKHPDGKEFKIAKSALEKATHEKIRKMADGGVVQGKTLGETIGYPGFPKPSQPPKMMAEGGDVEADEPDTETDEPAEAPGMVMGQPMGPMGATSADQASIPGVIGPSSGDTPVNADAMNLPLPEPTSTGAEPQKPALTMPDEVVQAQAPAGKPGFMGLPGDYAKAFQNQAGAIDLQAKAAADQAKANQNALEDYQNQVKIQNYNHQENMKSITKDQETFMKDYKDGKVDPNRLLGHMDTGQKITAGLAIALGGLGAGLTGQPNAAMEVLNKAIDRDIDAQKIDLGKKHTLYSMNLDKYKNEEMADAATRLNANTLLQAKIQASAAKAGTPEANARAKMLTGDLQMKAASLKYQMSMMSLQAQAVGSGSGKGGFQVGKTPPALAMDKGYQEKAVKIGNWEYQAHSKENADELRKTEGYYQPIEDDINKLKDIGAEGITSPEKREEVGAIMGRLRLNVPKFAGYSRMGDEKAVEKLFTDPTSLKSLVTGTGATADTLKSFQTRMEKMRDQNLAGYKGAGSFRTSAYKAPPRK